jgi:hypothetical protein
MSDSSARLFTWWRSDLDAEPAQRLEPSDPRTRVEDREDRSLADVLHRREPEPNAGSLPPVKSSPLTLTSGGRTGTSISRHSPMYLTSRSVSPFFGRQRAAMK